MARRTGSAGFAADGGVLMVAVAVTGATGFIGQALLRVMRDSPFDALAITRSGSSGAGLAVDDLTDPNRLAELLVGHDVRGVCHLGWSGHPRSADVSHADELEVNVRTTLNVALACGLAHVPHMIFISSGGGRSTSGAEDGYPPPYGWGKAVAAASARSTATSFRFALTVLRPTAVYGPGQDPRKRLGAVSVFAANLLDGVPLEVLGSTETRRDFLHVDDLAALIIRVLELRLDGEFDVGGPELLSLHDVIETLSAAAAIVPTVVIGPFTGVDPPTVRLSNDRISAATDWAPRRTLDESVGELLRYQILASGSEQRHAAVLARLGHQ